VSSIGAVGENERGRGKRRRGEWRICKRVAIDAHAVVPAPVARAHVHLRGCRAPQDGFIRMQPFALAGAVMLSAPAPRSSETAMVFMRVILPPAASSARIKLPHGWLFRKQQEFRSLLTQQQMGPRCRPGQVVDLPAGGPKARRHNSKASWRVCCGGNFPA